MSTKVFVILAVLFLVFAFQRCSVLDETRAPRAEKCQSVCRSKYPDKVEHLKVHTHALWGTEEANFGAWDFWVFWRMPDGVMCFCTIEEVSTHKLKADPKR